MSELTIEELRGVQLAILSDIHIFCQMNNIRYYLAWGTLLGAVRHRGYIPWDNDIDIMIPRRDYQRFVRTFSQSSHQRNLTVGSPASHTRWPFPFAKVSDSSTRLIERTDTAVELGVNVDVFPIDGCPNRTLSRWLQRQKLRMYRDLLACKAVQPRMGRSLHRALFLRLSKAILKSVPTATIVSEYSRVASKYPCESSEQVGVRVGPKDWCVSANALGAPLDIYFANSIYKGPRSPSEVLKSIYGDYMTLPPEANRVTHHSFEATWA